MLSGPKTFPHISSVFFRSLIGNFLSFAFFRFLIGNFFLFSLFFFLVFFREQGWTFSPWVKVYGKSGFWLKHCRTAGHDICQGLVWFRAKGDVPHYFHDTNATMMILKFYAKLVMHAPMWTLKCRKFFGHVIQRLRIHFLYFSQPSVSKICSFINLCIHPSPFWAFGKIFTAFTL